MRLVIMLSSFLICICVTVFSNIYVTNAMNAIEKEARIMEAILSEAGSGDFPFPKELENEIFRGLHLLEILVPHEDLHDLSVQLADASISAQIGDMDDCRKALKLIMESADHLTKHESLQLGNIF
ncbi:MAG: DUF4363 family protein [Clostridia bacterium]|nr:DUF4363 family protein [Clostridia bacterium]